MKKLLFLLALTLVVAVVYFQRPTLPPLSEPVAAAQPADAALIRAIRAHARNVRVEGEGTVMKVLPDDTEGTPHQRFILRLASGETILIAHNIDLAPGIPSLRQGDTVGFNGEYEWNAQGGVVHWTHHDPSGRHQAGWLKHNGTVYR